MLRSDRPVADASGFDALARTLGLEESSLGVLETIRPGTLAIPRTNAPAAPDTLDERTTLPRFALVSADAPGTGIADLELVSLIGQGGMGAVWLARQRALRREVAVKRVTAGIDGASVALIGEARTAGALEHPSILPVHAIGVDADGAPLLVMKRVEGATLDALCRDPGHPAWPELIRRHEDRIGVIVEVLMRVADALHFAHSRGYVHRDVKPENIMVGAFGETHLLDWGVALNVRAIEREAHGYSIVGTPAFMAPEMAKGTVESMDARTDVYLLGATLHAALVGAPRHAGTSLHQVLLAALASMPVRYDASVPAELAALANRATSADPNERPQTALAFRDALADFLRHRASLRLAERAAESLAVLGVSPSVEKLTAVEGARALVEARFGFTQALRDWEGNDAARAGLRSTLRLLVEAELARRSPEAAASIAAELEPRDAELDARIEALRGEVAKARLLEDAARAEAHERDPRVRRGARIAVGLAFPLIGVVIVAVMVMRRGGALPTAEEALIADLSFFAVCLVVLAVFRRAIAANRWGRQTAWFTLIVLLLPTAFSVLAVVDHATVEEQLPFRMAAIAATIATGAISVSRLFVVPALLSLASAFILAIWPAIGQLVQVIVAFAITGAILLELMARRSGKGGVPP
jgi:hypothetical protein